MANRNELLRVTQMNAIYLDKEIHNSFINLLNEATKNLSPGFIAPIEPELNLMIKLAILYNSLYKNGSTFGQQLLSIKYKDISFGKRICYMISECLEYVKSRFELSNPRHGINNLFFNLHLILAFLNFWNLLNFLSNGKQPRLIERFLNLQQIYIADNVQRQYESRYVTRELLWNGYIEILVNILPLINYHKIKRLWKNSFFNNKIKSKESSNRILTVDTKCAFCSNKLILPHHMGCAHIFCYICLKGNLTADSKFECPLCGHTNLDPVCVKVNVQ